MMLATETKKYHAIIIKPVIICLYFASVPTMILIRLMVLLWYNISKVLLVITRRIVIFKWKETLCLKKY